MHQYDHRFAAYKNNKIDDVDEAFKNISFEITTRHHLLRKDLLNRLASRNISEKWLLGFRDISKATNERSVIAAILPLSGVGNNINLITNVSPRDALILVSNLNCLVFDFCCRLKMAGSHVSIWFMKQLPVIDVAQLDAEDIDFIVSRSFELTYTSFSLSPFAQAVGYIGMPFEFDSERRHRLKCELDAYYAKLYGLTRDELRYILDPCDVMGEDYPSETFRVLKNKEIKEFGEYRTRRLVLEAWDKLEAGTLKTAPIQLEVTRSEGTELIVSTQNLPDNDWQRPKADLQAETVLQLAAILRACVNDISIQNAKFALLVAMEPRIFVPFLDPERRAEWLRLNGSDAAPLADGVTRLQPNTQRHWGEAIHQLRGDGLLIENLQERTWSPGGGLNAFPSQAWAEGRARFVMAWLNSGVTVADVASELPQELRGWLHENVA